MTVRESLEMSALVLGSLEIGLALGKMAGRREAYQAVLSICAELDGLLIRAGINGATDGERLGLSSRGITKLANRIRALL